MCKCRLCIVGQLTSSKVMLECMLHVHASCHQLLVRKCTVSSGLVAPIHFCCYLSYLWCW